MSLRKDEVRILSDPNAKSLRINTEYKLSMHGNDNREQTDTFMVVTPFVAAARFNNVFWQPEGQYMSVPEEFGYLTSDKFLLFTPDAEQDFCSIVKRTDGPDNKLPFVLYAKFYDRAEAYISTAAPSTPLHLQWKDERATQLFRLCFEAIIKNAPDIAIQLARFLIDLKEQGHFLDHEEESECEDEFVFEEENENDTEDNM